MIILSDLCVTTDGVHTASGHPAYDLGVKSPRALWMPWGFFMEGVKKGVLAFVGCCDSRHEADRR